MARVDRGPTPEGIRQRASGVRSGTLVVTLRSLQPGGVCTRLGTYHSFSVTVRNVPNGTRTVRVLLRTTKTGTVEVSTLAAGTIAAP